MATRSASIIICMSWRERMLIFVGRNVVHKQERMVWNPFGSKTSNETVGTAPTRADRERCWERRDLYFDCLDQAGVLMPGKEGERCRAEREGFEANCVKSWVSF